MKKKLLLTILILNIFNINAQQQKSKKNLEDIPLSINQSQNNFLYLDFPKKNRDPYLSCIEYLVEGKTRYGYILRGYKEGRWLTGNAGFDKKGNTIAKGKIWTEENFKNGLRDDVFKQYDSKGKIIYQTTFKKGTGLWKAFHNNGSLYFEMYTKDGYFTDTLRLHDDKGNMIGKLLYKRDSLIYGKGEVAFPDHRYKVSY